MTGEICILRDGVIQMRKGIGNIVIFIGSMLIMCALFSARLFLENSIPYYNAKEGGMVYGILILLTGIVLKFHEKTTILQLIWGMWSYLFLVQILRLFPKQVFISHVMNSVEIFWGVIGLGFVLLNFSIWWKAHKIF